MQKIVIFGGSGNLAKLKLIYEISKLKLKNLEIIAYGRSDLSRNYTEKLLEFHKDYSEDFLSTIKYVKGEYDDLSVLKSMIDEMTILYFAVPPLAYNTLLRSTKSINHRIIAIEKPFGYDKETFDSLEITDKCIFIDHYLSKPLSLVLPYLKNENSYFKNILRNEFIDRVEVNFKETITAKGIANFDRSGTIKDVIQNHMLEMVAILFYELEIAETSGFAKARADVINSLKADVTSLVKGQYDGYEFNNSQTESFAHFKSSFVSGPYNGINIYFTAGKALNEKDSSVVIFIKEGYELDYLRSLELKMNIKPQGLKIIFSFMTDKGISIVVNTVNSHETIDIITWEYIEVLLNKHYKGLSDYAYIFNSLLLNKNINMAEKDDVVASWNFITPLLEIKNKQLIKYKPKSDPIHLNKK